MATLQPYRPALLVCLLLAAQARAQSLETLLERMSGYLRGYETQLSEVVGNESYVQNDNYRDSRQNVRAFKTRRLESEVAFLRLPENGYWYGFRETRTVDRKPIPAPQFRLTDFVSSKDLNAQRALMMAISTEHNLGTFRNINMPTVPLEVLQAARMGKAAFELDGGETIRGVKTRRVRFKEIGVSTLIAHMKSESVKTSGAAWIDPANGRVWRAEIDCRDPLDKHESNSDRADNFLLRVDYRMDAKLGIMVPFEMYENFPGSVMRGDGKARYSNFRKFQTSARMITPPSQ